VQNAWAQAVAVEFADSQLACDPDAFGPYQRNGVTDLHLTNRVHCAQPQLATAAVGRALDRWRRVDGEGIEHDDESGAQGRAEIADAVVEGDIITLRVGGDARNPRQAATMLRILGEELRRAELQARIQAG
jgi:hypothetical protein